MELKDISMERSNTVMKKVVGPYMSEFGVTSPIEIISAALDQLPKQKIEYSPWSMNGYKPDVFFTIAHGQQCLLIKYYVSESVIKGAYYKPNDPVYKDSCVEFFIAFENDKEYYNCEFNVLGTCKLNYGTSRKDRKEISEKEIISIRYSVNIENQFSMAGKPEVQWKLTLVIPLHVFTEHKLTSLAGKTCRINFFKCGDELPLPHFLCWNRIESEHPDFHQPEYFGQIEFGALQC